MKEDLNRPHIKKPYKRLEEIKNRDEYWKQAKNLGVISHNKKVARDKGEDENPWATFIKRNE
jgi:hypothetical protein